jgi:serine/threonine protein phosphatase PrpC
MRIGERAGLSDPGRRRRRNEDSFVVEPPLFVVADGMGGAQAGEVASRLAASAFREFHEADDLDAAERVTAIVQEANRRIYDRAAEDRSVSGMGTTVTAALVEEGGITIGHVGDSRAYRIRDAELEQLTDDHSLVADLVRGGRLSPEEADTHPQRSVITRALGTDPSVDVDTTAVNAEPGDVFLLCSDGLTSMVADEEILRIVSDSASLDDAAAELVKAANRSGGEDNITVVLFRVDGAAEETAVMETDGMGDTDELEDTLAGIAALPETPEPDRDDWGPAPEPDEEEDEARVVPQPLTVPKPRPAPRRNRRLFFVLASLGFVTLILLVAFWGLANAHFVGAEEDGHVAVYQGLPYDLGGGVRLYRVRYVSTLEAAQLSAQERAELFDHDLMSFGATRDRIAPYEDEAGP